MKTALSIILMCLISTTAWADLDSVHDSIGVYFDAYGNGNHVPSLPLFNWSSVYCLLLNASAPIKGYEFTYTLNDSPNLIRTGTTLPAGAIDADASENGFAVGLATAVPPAYAMTLAVVTFMQIGGVSCCFFIGSGSVPSLPGNLPVIDGGPGYGLRHANVASGSVDLPVGGIGFDVRCHPIANDASSFGNVKSLFR